MPEPTRRELIAGGGSLVAALVAGCTSTRSPSESEAAGSQTEVGDAATGPEGGTPTTRNGLPTRAEVAMTSMPRIAYEPRLVHVAQGGTVVWRLDSGSHDATAYHPETKPPHRDEPAPRRIPADADPWASPTLSMVGKTFAHSFDVVGVYDYVDTEVVCTSHTMVGNVGRIVVGWPDAEGQPALQPPQEQIPELVAQNLRELNTRTRALLANGPPSDAPNIDQ